MLELPLGSGESSLQVKAAQRAAVTLDQSQAAMGQLRQEDTNSRMPHFPTSGFVSSAAHLN